MNKWLVIVAILGILTLATVTIVVNTQAVQADDASTKGSCSYGEPGCPYKKAGGCTQAGNCGLDTCAAKYGGGCGCGR